MPLRLAVVMMPTARNQVLTIAFSLVLSLIGGGMSAGFIPHDYRAFVEALDDMGGPRAEHARLECVEISAR